uniref:cysteine synthase A n=1 Tax=Agathobacter sp. TaxID=2021311 RepID=UPI004057117A
MKKAKNIYRGIAELVGNTPLVELVNIEEKLDLKARILAKMESLNPAGSAKDRVAKEMIEQAEADGRLKPGGTIIEPTSGNTGIGLASMATVKGYRAIIVLPDTMSIERINIMKAYGAEVVLSDGKLGMKGAIAKAKELQQEIEGSFIPDQFENPANADVHRKTTGPEIWEDTNGNVDIFVAGIGTGGTITGVGEYLKAQKPDIKVIGVEPASSPFLTKGKAGAHKIQGIGAGFAPGILNTNIYDEIMTVEDEAAIEYGKLMAKTEGVLVGISAGAALYAAIETAKKPENQGKTIVVVMPDNGDRYYSTGLFQD